MTQQQSQISMNSTLSRPVAQQRVEGFLNGAFPHPSGDGANVILGFTRKSKRGGQEVDTAHQFTVAVYGRDAALILAMYADNAGKQKEDRTKYFINLNTMLSCPKAAEGEKQYGMQLNGWDMAWVDPKTRNVLDTAREWAVRTNWVSPTAQQAPANQSDGFGGQQQQTA